MEGRRQKSFGVGQPLLLSLVLHGALVAGLWLTPSRDVKQARMAVETGVILSLTGEPEIRTAAVSPGLPNSGDNEESEYIPKLIEAPPAAALSGRNNSRPFAALPSPGPEIPPSGIGQAKPATAGSQGAGIAPARTPLFGPVAPGQRVVFLLDRSLSMGFHHALDRARGELLATVKNLPSTARFQIIAYNQQAEPIYFDGGFELLTPSEMTFSRVAYVLEKLLANGRTDHDRALRRGLALRPDLIYLVTDADDMKREEVQAITRLNANRVAIHAVELSGRRGGRADGALRLLAQANHGTYRQVMVEE